MSNCSWSLQTPKATGAIAIVQLEGDVDYALEKITGKKSWQTHRMRLVNIHGVDEVIAVKLKKNTAQIMLHGGMQVLREFESHCEQLGFKKCNASSYSEAANSAEASMLNALAIATSAEAIDLLLSQPTKLQDATPTEEDIARSKRLDFLITSPKIVLLGKPNTGKSTLMNALTREQTSIVHHLPGATRDAVGARINCAGLILDVYDLPGFRKSEDSIEEEAISIAKKIYDESDLVLRIADQEHQWLEDDAKLSLRVGTKSDIALRSDADICVCATTGQGIQELGALIRETLVPQKDITCQKPWFFLGYKPTDE